jgi:hypothetical protein
MDRPRTEPVNGWMPHIVILKHREIAEVYFYYKVKEKKWILKKLWPKNYIRRSQQWKCFLRFVG